MSDLRYAKLASVLINHSTEVKQGESVLVEATDVDEDMMIELIRQIRRAGGLPLVSLKSSRVIRELVMETDAQTMKQTGDYEAYRMKGVHVHIGIHGDRNMSEMSDVPSEKMQLYRKHWISPVHSEIHIPHTRWFCFRWPSPAMAQQANMSTEAFEDFYFKVCTLDYSKMEAAVVPLKELMEKTNEVRIMALDTDLTFSIRKIPVVSCTGRRNLPDGECYTAPVRNSVNGTIKFNVAVNYQGTILRDIHLRFENGKVVESSADNSQKLTEILNTDERARYIGEFAVAFNPYINVPMLNTVFDEKIAGSIHLALGNSYSDADNGNRSAIHMDMVMIQRTDWGGGEIFFDNILVRKDGIFVVSGLDGLNPGNLY